MTIDQLERSANKKNIRQLVAGQRNVYGGLTSKVFKEIISKLESEENALKARGVTNFTREFFVEARYLNQQWEMEFKIPMLKIENSEDVSALVEEFHNVHFRRYAVKEEGGTIECINWKGRLIAEMSKPPHAREAVST